MTEEEEFAEEEGRAEVEVVVGAGATVEEVVDVVVVGAEVGVVLTVVEDGVEAGLSLFEDDTAFSVDLDTRV